MPRARSSSVPAPARRPPAGAPAPRRGAATAAAERRRLTRELRALAHPIRLRLLQHFAGAPRTTMQVAALMGEPPTRLYHHVNALQRAGILKLESTRQVRGTTEKYFRLARHQIGVGRASDATPRSRTAMRGLAAMVFDEARAELLSALADPRAFTKETPPLALRMQMSVPASHQARIRRRIFSVIEAIRRELKGRTDPSAPRWALTLGFAPTSVKK